MDGKLLCSIFSSQQDRYPLEVDILIYSIQLKKEEYCAIHSISLFIMLMTFWFYYDQTSSFYYFHKSNISTRISRRIKNRIWDLNICSAMTLRTTFLSSFNILVSYTAQGAGAGTVSWKSLTTLCCKTKSAAFFDKPSYLLSHINLLFLGWFEIKYTVLTGTNRGESFLGVESQESRECA